MKHLFSTLALIFALTYSSTACTAAFSYAIYGDSVAVHGGIDETGSFTYTWNFGEGPNVTGEVAGHRYANIGTFNICLYVTNNNGCTSHVCHEVVIPTPECTATIAYAFSGTEVHFTGTGNANELFYHWNFGDNSGGTGSNPVHSYANQGTYYVCLTVYNGFGCQTTVCDSVHITPCQAYFNYTTDVNNVYTFHNYSLGSNLTYNWNFGDGTLATGEVPPTHTYAESGTYHACLTISNDAGCESTFCHDIVVTLPSPCVPSYTYTVSGSSVSFVGSSTESGVSYYWHFGDGTSGTGENTTHNYTLFPEHYNVCLIIINTATGCHDSICQNIFVPGPCQAYFNTQSTTNPVVFANYSQGGNLTYAWDFGDGTTGTGATPDEHNYPASGTYHVCLTIHNSSGCENTFCRDITVTVTNPCQAYFNYTNVENVFTFHNYSQGSNLFYAWDYGDGHTGTGEVPDAHTYAASGTYHVCLTIHNTSGCENTYCRDITVTVPPPPCEASFSYTITGTEVHFHGISNTSGVTYHWNFGDQSDATGENPVHNYTIAPEHYIVCLTISNNSGCHSTFCDTIFIQSNTNTACEGSFTYSISGTEVHFHGMSNVSGVNYGWHFGDGTTGGGENPVHNYAQGDTVTVCLIIYNTNGCQNTHCETIIIPDTGNGSNDCLASFTYTMEGNVVAFHGTSNVQGVYYYWSFGDGQTGSGENQTHTFVNYPQHYQVCLTIYNNNGCQNTYCQTIYVQSNTTNDCHGSFTYTTSGNIVHFVGSSTDPNASYYWTFGDGTTGTGQAPDGHAYTQFPEHYNVCLVTVNTATNCIDTVCQTIYIQEGTQCSAEFTYTITGNEVHFTGPSNTSGTHYQWSFGDGASSDMHNPNHAYTLFPEHYEVCLTVINTANNCNETSCQTIFIQQGNGTQDFELAGTIYTGQNYADVGYVMLIQYNPNTGMLWAAQTVGIGANGHYVFHAPAGNYFLKAALSPNSAVYANFLPTYYVHDLFWYNAAVISLTSNQTRSFHLIEGNNPGGPGFIGGLVTQGANKAEGPGDPVDSVQVMLLAMNDDPLQCTFSNAFGEFSFSNVAYGTYQVYGEIYNLTTIPAIVTVDGITPSIVDINLLVTSREVTTGVFEPTVVNESNVGQVFPNPFKGDAAINISLQNDAIISIRMFDITGRLVYTDVMNLYAGAQQINLPVSSLTSGIYSLSLTDQKSNSTVTRKLVKTE